MKAVSTVHDGFLPRRDGAQFVREMPAPRRCSIPALVDRFYGQAHEAVVAGRAVALSAQGRIRHSGRQPFHIQ